MRLSGPLLCLLSVLAAASVRPAGRSAAAQEFRIPAPLDSPATRKARRARVQEGRALAKKGDRAATYAHFLDAVRSFPEAPEILEGLLVHAPNDSMRRFWAHRYAAARTLESGSFNPGATAAAALPKDDPFVARLAAARVRAAEDLAALLNALEENAPSTPLVTVWAAGTLWAITRHAPAVRARFAQAFNRKLEPRTPDFRPILKRLAALQAKAAASGDLARAIRIGACLNGFETQARFPGLQGPRPNGIGKGRNRTAETLRRLQERRRRADSAPADLEELERIPPAARPAFSQRHASFGNPATGRSVGGRYRIETIAGIETLLAAARTVERHHQRLVKWLAQDPCPGRAGLIRIVPAPADLESESAPDWWASGFQRGDTTFIRLAWGTTGDLGRVLTQQLTHRFDAAIHPGLPAWLAEGRAVWTAHAYGLSTDPAFRPVHAVFERMEDADRNGLGEPDRLKKLIEDRVEDARDRGNGGYALYVYLASESVQGRPRYADRLAEFMRACGKTRKQRFSLFLKHFVDGRDGRPGDFVTFAAEFRAFLRGFRGPDPAPWTERYRSDPSPEDDTLLGDVPSWIGGRTRAAPWFGEAHARTAASLLHQAGEHELAIAAWCWSLTVDEWKPDDVVALAELLYAQWDRIGAWALQCEVRRRFPGPSAPGPVAPPSSVPREGIRALLEAYRAAVIQYRRLDDAAAAAALACEHNRIAERLGARRVSLPDAETLPAIPAPPGAHVGAHGWIETGLVDFEERRVRGRWYAEPGGDLMLGRNRPPPQSGAAEAEVRPDTAFVRGGDWIARGRYVVRTRVHPETADFSGALVLGYARRDRNVRVRFEAGERSHTVDRDAKGDARHRIPSVTFRIGGRFRRDRSLPGARPRRVRKLASPRASFLLEAFVEGDQVHVRVDGEPLASYRTPDGSPIEGYVGFASKRGAYRAESPVIGRFHGIPRERLPGSWPRGLNPTEPQERSLTDLVNRTAVGIPRRAAGTVVLWIPPVAGGAHRTVGAPAGRKGQEQGDENGVATEKLIETRALALITGLRRSLQAVGYREPPVVAVPDVVSEATRKKLRKALDSRGAVGVKILTHGWPAAALPAGEPGRTAGQARPGATRAPDPLLLFLDSAGTLRTVEPFPLAPATPRLPPLISVWAWVLATEARAGIRGGEGR